MCLRFQFCTHQRVCILYFLKKSQIRCTLASTHLFEGSSTHFLRGLEHSLFKRALALIIWRTTKQRTNEWTQVNMKEIKFMKCSLEKMRARTHYIKGARAPIFLRARAPIIYEGSSTHYLRGHEHSLFEEHSNREQMNECKMNIKKRSSWNALLKNEGAHPLF